MMVKSKSQQNKKAERPRIQLLDFDVIPLSLIQQKLAERNELLAGELDDSDNYPNLSLTMDIRSLLSRNFALPPKYRKALTDAGDALSGTVAAVIRPQKFIDLGLAPPRLKSALSKSEIGDRLAQIYVRAADLILAMRGTPLLYARHVGDREGLVRQLRSGYWLSREAREYAADIIEGKVRRQANRPKRQEDDLRNRTIVWFILEAREGGMGDDSSIEAAVDEFNLGRRP